MKVKIEYEASTLPAFPIAAFVRLPSGAVIYRSGKDRDDAKAQVMAEVKRRAAVEVPEPEEVEV